MPGITNPSKIEIFHNCEIPVGKYKFTYTSCKKLFFFMLQLIKIVFENTDFTKKINGLSLPVMKYLNIF